MIINPAAFDRIDHGALRAFSAAARALSFTKAAELAAMTQSGVSQNIARLERQLGAQLFARVKRQVSLTRAGEILLGYVDRHLEHTERLLDEVHGEVGRLAGPVRYAMPHSCLFTPHFPLLLDARRKGFPEVAVSVRLCPNEEIRRLLLDRQIDFGFVTQRGRHPAERYEKFGQEQYILVGSDRGEIAGLTAASLLQSRFVAYPGMDVLYRLWAGHHFGAKAPPFEALRTAGSIDSLHGAITMASRGVGVSVFPKHCVDRLLRDGALHEFVSPRRGCLNNDIWIVSLKEVEQPRRVRAVLDAFWAMK